TVVSQGEKCSDLHHLESGLVKLTLVSKKGKGAVLGVLGQGDFFGEACISGDMLYRNSAITLMPSAINLISGKSMLLRMKENPAFAMRFINYLLARNLRIEQDLIDHMLHFSEKRLARTLLWLAQPGQNGDLAPFL